MGHGGGVDGGEKKERRGGKIVQKGEDGCLRSKESCMNICLSGLRVLHFSNDRTSFGRNHQYFHVYV